MKTKFYFVLFIGICGLTTSCSVSEKVSDVKPNQKIDNFLNSTNLVFSKGAFWVMDLPESADILGNIYEKRDTIIDSVKIEAFNLIGTDLFDSIPNSNVIKSSILYGKDFEFSRAFSSDLAVVSMFSGSTNNVFEIQKKVELKNVLTFNSKDMEPKPKYNNPKYFYVSKVLIGTSSDYGLSQHTYRAKFAGFDVGAGLEASGKSSYHVIKEGVLSLILLPAANLYDMSKSLIGNQSSIDEDLIKQGYKKINK